MLEKDDVTMHKRATADNFKHLTLQKSRVFYRGKG